MKHSGLINGKKIVSYERVLSQNPHGNSWYIHILHVGTSLNLLSYTLQILENDLVHTVDLVCVVGKKASEM